MLDNVKVAHCFLVSSCMFATGSGFCFSLPDFIVSKYIVSFKLSQLGVCDHQASVYLAHASTCSLLATLVSYMALSSHIIYVSISFSYKP